jgi:peptide/nickel transport system permease protein
VTVLTENRVTRVRSTSPTGIALRHLLRSHVAVASLAVLLLFVLLALLAQVVAPQDPYLTSVTEALAAPSRTHPMGTDLLGRDVLSRVIYGARVSMMIGFISVGISAVIGVLWGLTSGYIGGQVDNILMRFIDMMMAFPGLLLAMTIVALLGPGVRNVMIAVGIGGIPSFARLIRGSVLSVKEEVYVEAARCVGVKDRRIVFRHIMPNCLAPVLVLASMSYGWALLSSAGLSFIGLGAQPPVPEWGAMLSDGRALLWDAPWTAIFPGLAILFVVLAANLLGDAVRDALDPRLRL